MYTYIYIRKKFQVETSERCKVNTKKLCACNLDKIKANGYNSKMKVEGD